MGKFIDLTGQRFGRLVVESYCRDKNNRIKWNCTCDCGKKTVVYTNALTSGTTKSCGCFNSDYHKENCKDLTGQRFGMWTTLYRTTDKKGHVAWMCRCDCGTERIILTAHLINGSSTNCGCKRVHPTTHNMSGTRLYRIYQSMIQRCNNPNNKAYCYYGGKGICIYSEWLGEHGFENFAEWSFENGYTDTLTIDRKDSNGNYEPSNCRWADYTTQLNNTTRNHLVTCNGETHTIAEWSKITGINSNTLNYRVRKGWDEDRLFIPPKT